MDRLRQFLQVEGNKIQSASMLSLAAHLDMSADPFVKVRGIIKDLIDRLEEEAKNEATAKTVCDDQIKEAVEKRDAQKLAIEDNKAKSAAANAEIKRLNG